MRRLVVLLIPLALAGCGGSKSTSSSSTRTASVTLPPVVKTTPTTGTETTVTLTKTSATTTTGAVNARVPARFTIGANGTVTPPTITVPAHFAVELTVASDGQAHHIALRTTTLSVPAHGRATKRITGLRTGSYPLKIDGAPRAVLTIGGAPGP